MAKTPSQPSGERQFVRRVLIVLGLAALFFLLWQLRILFLMLFGAIVVATIFRSVADTDQQVHATAGKRGHGAFGLARPWRARRAARPFRCSYRAAASNTARNPAGRVESGRAESG